MSKQQIPRTRKSFNKKLTCRLSAFVNISNEAGAKPLNSKKKLSIIELSKLCDVSATVLYKYAKNEADSYHAFTIARICDALGVTPGDLFEIKEVK